MCWSVISNIGIIIHWFSTKSAFNRIWIMYHRIPPPKRTNTRSFSRYKNVCVALWTKKIAMWILQPIRLYWRTREMIQEIVGIHKSYWKISSRLKLRFLLIICFLLQFNDWYFPLSIQNPKEIEGLLDSMRHIMQWTRIEDDRMLHVLSSDWLLDIVAWLLFVSGHILTFKVPLFKFSLPDSPCVFHAKALNWIFWFLCCSY